MRPLRKANGSGAGTLSESLPCGRQEIFNPPAGEGLRLSVPVLLFISSLAFFPNLVSQLFSRIFHTILSPSFPLHYLLIYLFLPSLFYSFFNAFLISHLSSNYSFDIICYACVTPSLPPSFSLSLYSHLTQFACIYLLI